MNHRRTPAVLVLMTAVTISATLTLGCKKTPPPVASTPEPPSVQKSEPPPEPVRQEPVKPVVETPIPVRQTSADEFNKQGILKAIYFDFDKYDIRSDQVATLQANADRLKSSLSRFKVRIEGNCDERGTNEYNINLGDRRADATRQFLINLGVPESRIRTVSFGEERSADPGHNEEAWARNRRCEFVLEEG